MVEGVSVAIVAGPEVEFFTLPGRRGVKLSENAEPAQQHRQ